MNCEHGVDIDEYTCRDCQKSIEIFEKKYRKEKLIKTKKTIEKCDFGNQFDIDYTFDAIREYWN